MPKTLNDRIREYLSSRPSGATINAKAQALRVSPGKDRRTLANRLRDMVSRGELERIGRGAYRLAPKTGAPQLREVMWRLLRARRSVTVDDLVELSGASRAYAHEFLQALVRQGVVKKPDHTTFQLAADPVALPENTAKTEKLRRAREAKKTALASLDAAFAAIAEARMAVAEIDTDQED